MARHAPIESSPMMGSIALLFISRLHFGPAQHQSGGELNS